MQGANPSEILGQLRNDGRSMHHMAEAHKAVDELEVKLAEIKSGIQEARKVILRSPEGEVV